MLANRAERSASMRSNAKSSSADALLGAASVLTDLWRGIASGIGVASDRGQERPISLGGFNQRATLTFRRLPTGNVELKYTMSGSRQEATSRNPRIRRLGNW